MVALAYFCRDPSKDVRCDPPEGKEEPEQQLFWDAERRMKYYMSDIPSTLEEEIRDVKSLIGRLRKNQHAYISGQRSEWSPANADWNRDPDIEEELDFSNAYTLKRTSQVQHVSE
jgi:hypothetical protein